MKNNIISKIESYGYKVNNRGEIFKFSNSTKSKEKAGIINEGNVYFFAQNVSPFKHGTNSFREILGNEYTFVPHIAKPKEVEATHDFSFEDYTKATKSKNQFSIFLKQYTEKNPYDIRGIKNGYLEDATLFPYINYEDKFITAKVVKYNSNTGKRIKTQYSNTWFHAYKPIKKELDIEGKITKKIDCFFGEHLLNGNTKPVVIVEAEKTAIILSLIYEDIVFLASGGLGKLKVLKHDFLKNRKVYVFPDNGALEWFKIAKERNWWISEVLENKGTKGSDAADYLDTEIGNEIAKELDNIILDKLGVNKERLGFTLKQKQKYKVYCIPNFQVLDVNHYQDHAKGKRFHGLDFTIFETNFKVLSANIDFNKWKIKEGKFVQVDEKEFIKRLEKCYRVMKHLNPEANHKKIFVKILIDLNERSNFLFNYHYVENELLPIWDNDTNDISEYYKVRNWRFKSKKHIEDKDFVSLLANDKKRYSTNKFLIRLQKRLDIGGYIKAIDIGLTRRQENDFIYNLLTDYNKNVLGCNTINNYNQKLELSKYINFVASMVVQLDPNAKSYKNLHTPYYKPNIVCAKSCTTFKKPNIQTVFDNTLIHKSIIREYLNFKPNEVEAERINTTVLYLISNPLDLKFERINKRIKVEVSKSIEYMLESLKNDFEKEISRNDISLNDAFGYDLDLKDSILNVEQSDAIQFGSEFLSSWIYFHYPNISEWERHQIRMNPFQWIKNDNILLAS